MDFTLLADPVSRRAWIVFQLRLKGESFATIARRTGVSRQAVRKALYLPYPRMEQVIASELGLQPHVLFPERYGANGESLARRLGRPKKIVVNSNRYRGQFNIEKEEK